MAILAKADTVIWAELPVPTRNISLTEELDKYVSERVAGGRYGNASDVVRAGLRSLEREEQEHAAKLAALRDAIADGYASGIAPEGSFDRARAAVVDRRS